MPKLYEYFGLVIFFYSNEHEPIHENGVVKTLKLKSVTGRQPLATAQAKDFKKLASVLADEIVQSWVNYFVYHKKIVAKKIAGKL